jgi:hypothetical protein
MNSPPNWAEGVEYPLDPAVTFGRLAASRQQEIDALSTQLRADQLAANKFTADLANFLVQRTTRDVEILEGRELANQRMQRFRPEKSMWGILQDANPADWRPETFPDREHLERGVEIRYLFPEAYWKRPGAGRNPAIYRGPWRQDSNCTVRPVSFDHLRQRVGSNGDRPRGQRGWRCRAPQPGSCADGDGTAPELLGPGVRAVRGGTACSGWRDQCSGG